MKTKSSNLHVTLAGAFDVGKKQGSREILTEIQQMLTGETTVKELRFYVNARLKSILQLESNNPFKQKD